MTLAFLKMHRSSFMAAKPYADENGHTTPTDTKSWSQILVSMVTGVTGLERKKGADLSDGSDVKAANTWDAIDTPRFNGVIKAGTKSDKAGKLEYLDDLPNLYFVLWDNQPETNKERCRIWVVRPQNDAVFRGICSLWYTQREQGIIKSDNFQLHPPRGKNSNIFRNTCGNLEYPLLFEAVWNSEKDLYEITEYNPCVISIGQCNSQLKIKD